MGTKSLQAFALTVVESYGSRGNIVKIQYKVLKIYPKAVSVAVESYE